MWRHYFYFILDKTSHASLWLRKLAKRFVFPVLLYRNTNLCKNYKSIHRLLFDFCGHKHIYEYIDCIRPKIQNQFYHSISLCLCYVYVSLIRKLCRENVSAMNGLQLNPLTSGRYIHSVIYAYCAIIRSTAGCQVPMRRRPIPFRTDILRIPRTIV